MIATLYPAYGRTYPKKDLAIEHWTEGRDFTLMPQNTYVSIRDLDFLKNELGFKSIYIKYKSGGEVNVTDLKPNF